MFWLGALADRLPPRRAIIIALMLLGGAAVVMTLAHNPATLWLALFGLRLGGQGLTGHIAIVIAARHGESRRGRTLAVATFGFILGEALLPLSFAALLGVFHWRWLWGAVALFVLVVALPGLRALASTLPFEAMPPPGDARTPAAMSRLELLATPKFLAVLPVALISPFLITAIFLHQGTLSALRGWHPTEVAFAIVLFAATQAAGTWLNGRLVDRFGARSLFRWYTLPTALAMLALAGLPDGVSLWPLFAGIGLSAGGNNVIVSAIWVELFGSRQLGLIRGVYLGLMVLTTAIGPALLGIALAAELPLTTMALSTAAYTAVVPWLTRSWLR